MSKVLIYKTKEETISICIPSPKQQIQLNLKESGRDNFINCHKNCINFEDNKKNSYLLYSYNKRISWAKNVIDFDNINDEEYQNLIECDLPSDFKYKHWIDHSYFDSNDMLRDCWMDVDKNGVIEINPEKAKSKTIDHIANKIKDLRNQLQHLEDIGLSEKDSEFNKINEKIITQTNNIKKINSIKISTQDQISSILRPFLV